MFVIHETVTTTHGAQNQWTLSASYSPLSSVQELQVVSGVCSMLEAVGTLTGGVGCDAVGTWHGVPVTRLVSQEPCTHRSRPYVETSAGLPADGT